MLTDNQPISRSVIKSGNIHLVDFYTEDKVIGQVQLPADESNDNVMCLITADGYLELFGLRELEGLTAEEHCQQMRNHDKEMTFIEGGTLTVSSDAEELFVLVNNVPVLSLSFNNYIERYGQTPLAMHQSSDGRLLYIRGIHPTLKNHVPRVDLTQMGGDIINRFYDQIPVAYQRAVQH